MPTKPKNKETRSEPRAKEPTPARRPESAILAARESYRQALALFEKAHADLARKSFAAARDGFVGVLAEFPGETEIGDRARTYLKICERRLAEPPPEPSDAEALYLRAVVEANAGRLDRALALYAAVLKARPGDPAATYGTAVALALVGRKAEALKRLREAVAVSPQNRILALNDPDLEGLRDEPEFVDLVEPEESRGAGGRSV